MVSCENVCFSYDKEHDVLRGISLDIQAGEFVALIGANGSGKSTFARHLNALFVPSSGNVTIDGINTREAAQVQHIRRMVGMVFQNPDNQLVATVVEEDVAFGPENLCLPSREVCERVEAALRQVGMWEMRSSAPHRLSGGQKQRVAIAGVLAMRPRLIVLDEPTAMLDPMGRREVMEAVSKLSDEGISIVLITHFMEEAACAERVIVFDKGHVCIDGPPKEVFSKRDRLGLLGLGVPAIAELAHHMRAAGLDVGNVLTAEELVAAWCAAYRGLTHG